MFSLIDGIYLEDSGALLRWGCSRKEALSVGQPTDIDNRCIAWDEKILDGQRCYLIVNLAEDALFDQVRARFHRNEALTPDHDGLSLYRSLSIYFTKKIGVRPFAGFTEKYGEAPTLAWEHDRCILKLTVWDAGQQGGPATDLLISKR
jgi:hypothetical protein